MMTATVIDRDPRPILLERIERLRAALARIPLSAIEVLLRIGIAGVFWKSGMAKLANWDLTVALFADEYRVPLLSPEVAAALATAAEVTCPVLIVAGLGARFGAAALLGMTFVIQFFVYPGNWLEHLFWASVLIYIAARGAGQLSIDHLIARRLFAGARR